MTCSSARRNAPRRLAVALALAGVLAAPAAWAHGATLRASFGGVKPPVLVIRAGETVHFVNANVSPGPLTIASDDGSFESPPLARGEGWHHRFDAVGRFGVHVKGFESSHGQIVVAPAKPGASE
jgi:hypothetical protein